MKYIKKFEKVKRTYDVGDTVVWSHIDPVLLSKKLRVAPYSRNADYGDLCEISEVKGQKGNLYVKLYNKDKNTYVNKNLDASGSQRAIYNPLGHWIEASNWYIKRPQNFNWDIFSAIQMKRVDIVKNLIISLRNINMRDTSNKYTPLLLAGFINNLEIIEMLIDAGADWNQKYTNSNEDFFYFISDENKKSIIKKYPKKYDKYLMIKNSEKYNL